MLFLRQPNILHVLQDKYPLLKKNESLRNKINTVIADGTVALKKYRNHVELTILLSMFENEIMSFVPAHLKTHHETPQQQVSPKGSPGTARRSYLPIWPDILHRSVCVNQAPPYSGRAYNNKSRLLLLYIIRVFGWVSNYSLTLSSWSVCNLLCFLYCVVFDDLCF